MKKKLVSLMMLTGSILMLTACGSVKQKYTPVLPTAAEDAAVFVAPVEGISDDFIKGMDKFFPDLQSFKHAEGNSDAHIKSSAVGASETVIITGGKLLLGTWQDIYFCEFDGPRTRKFFVKVMGD